MGYIRNIVAEILGVTALFLWLPCYCIDRIKGVGVLSIYFHDPSKALFRMVVAFLSIIGYKFISVDKLHRLIVDDIDLPKHVAVLTFDDGWKGNTRLMPVIEKYHVPLTIFVTTSALAKGNFWWEIVAIEYGKEAVHLLKGKENEYRKKKLEECGALNMERSALTWYELEQLENSKFISIGGHTATHPILTMCNASEIKDELSQSKEIIENRIKKKVKYFAYPNGDFNEEVIEIVKRDYVLAFTTVPGYIKTDSDLYKLPRNAINDRGWLFENIAKSIGAWQATVGRIL